MQRRTFRNPTEQRSWWVETDGPLLRTASSSDDDPEWTVRERRLKSADAALADAATLIAEQLADGFTEEGEPPPAPEAPRALFERLAETWRAHGDGLPVEAWLGATLARGDTLMTRLVAELAALETAARHDADTWLRMRRPEIVDALLLALRDPRHAVRTGALHALREPGAREAEVEGAILSLIEHAPPLPHPGSEHAIANQVTVAKLDLSEAATRRLVGLTSHRDPDVATNAALMLARFPQLAERRVLEALRAWNARGELRDRMLALVTRQKLEAELGASIRAPGRGKTDASPAAIDGRLAVAIRSAAS